MCATTGRSEAGFSVGVRLRAWSRRRNSVRRCAPTSTRPERSTPDMRRPPFRFTLLLAAALLFFVTPAALRFYTDWLWFRELGYPQIFGTMLRAQTTTFTAVFAVSALWLAAHLHVALGAVGDVRPVFTTRDGLEVVLPGRQQLRNVALGVAVVVAVFIGLYASGQWLA